MRSRIAGLTGMIPLFILSGLARAQEPSQPRASYRTLAELDASYERQATELERRKLADLVALAGRASGLESERAYRAALDLAVARGFYREAEPAARAYMRREHGEPESQALAASVALMADADRGEFDRSLAELRQFMERRAAAPIPDDRRLPGALICAVGEAYLQRLIRGGRLDIARQVCRLAMGSGHPDAAVRDYFADRLARLEMVGKPAPAIEGTDVDGRPVRLADLKGQAVLVDFWATWCPPCVASIPTLRDLALGRRDRGFAVLGVNLDGLAQAPPGQPADPKETLAAVRWFLLEHSIPWPVVVGPAAEAAARSYQVNDVPASFLIGRDGTIIAVELGGESLARAVDEVLGRPTPAGRP